MHISNKTFVLVLKAEKEISLSLFSIEENEKNLLEIMPFKNIAQALQLLNQKYSSITIDRLDEYDTKDAVLKKAIQTKIDFRKTIALSIKCRVKEISIPDKNYESTKSENTFLSRRELAVLKLIAAEKTQQQIAKELSISIHTVIFHRRNLLLKLEVKNTAGLIKKAITMNLI